MPAGRCLAPTDNRHHFGLYVVTGVTEGIEAGARQRIRRQQPKQQVLCADVVVVQLTGLFLRAYHDVPGLPRESLKHDFIIKTMSIH